MTATKATVACDTETKHVGKFIVLSSYYIFHTI